MSEKKVMFRLKKIQEDEFFYNNLEFSKVKFNINNLKVSVSLGYDTNLDENTFIVFVSIRYNYKSGRKELEVVRLSFFVEYEIKDMNKVFDTKEKNQIELPDNILGSMVTLAIGTGRGILYSKTAGVPNINELYLPIIDAQSLINFYKMGNSNQVSK